MYIGILSLIVIAEAAVFIGGTWLGISVYAARKSAAPFFPTPARAIRQALREVGLKPGETFYDLGAGNGKALLIAERDFGARATGFEISSLFYWIAKINLRWHRSRAVLLAKDLFAADLRDADVIFCFLAIRTMAKMERKLMAELKPDARIIVYAFPLPTMTPTNILTVHGQWKMFFYKLH
jgi:SAM-dependent methyltransferase